MHLETMNLYQRLPTAGTTKNSYKQRLDSHLVTLQENPLVKTFQWEDTGALIVIFHDRLPSGANGLKYPTQGNQIQTVAYALRRIEQRFARKDAEDYV